MDRGNRARGRAPQGARGLKLVVRVNDVARGVRRAPQGARGLKSCIAISILIQTGRAPQGARGLKLLRHAEPEDAGRVAPRKGRVG